MLFKLNYWGSSLASRSCIVFKDLSRLARCFSRRADTCSFLAMESFVLSICSFRLRERERGKKKWIYVFENLLIFWILISKKTTCDDILQSYAAFPLSLTECNSQIPGCKFSQQRNWFLMITYKRLMMVNAFDEVISLHYFNLNSRTLGGKITVKNTFWFGSWLKTMEASFCHWIKKLKKGYCDFFSHNSDFFSQNCELETRNCEL